MATDRLEQLLQDADASAPPPMFPTGVTIRVRRRAARRATTARVAAGLFLAVGVAGVILWTLAHRPPQLAEGLIPGPTTRQVEPEGNAEVQQRFATELIRLRQESRNAAAVKAALLEPDAVEQVNAARERAALLLLADANRRSRSTASRGDAMDDYRQLIRLFPRTFAASQAAEKLGQMHESRNTNQQS